MDGGFKEGRQFGRGLSGGQVRDDRRSKDEYDPGRGGYGRSDAADGHHFRRTAAPRKRSRDDSISTDEPARKHTSERHSPDAERQVRNISSCCKGHQSRTMSHNHPPLCMRLYVCASRRKTTRASATATRRTTRTRERTRPRRSRSLTTHNRRHLCVSLTQLLHSVLCICLLQWASRMRCLQMAVLSAMRCVSDSARLTVLFLSSSSAAAGRPSQRTLLSSHPTRSHGPALHSSCSLGFFKQQLPFVLPQDSTAPMRGRGVDGRRAGKATTNSVNLEIDRR